MDFNQSITKLETKRTIHGFELSKRIGLLYHIDNTMMAIAKISSTTIVGQLHNRLQFEDYYNVSIYGNKIIFEACHKYELYTIIVVIDTISNRCMSNYLYR